MVVEVDVTMASGLFGTLSFKRFIRRASAYATISIVTLIGNAAGQPLGDLEQKMIRGDEGVQSSAFRALGDIRQVSAARFRDLPELSFFYRYTQGEFGLDDELFDPRFWMTARLSQDLVGLFKVRPARIGLARANADLSDLDLFQEKQAALYAFRSNYIDALLVREQIRVYGLILEQLTEQTKIEELRFSRKEILFSDLLKNEREVLRYEEMLQRATRAQDRLLQGTASSCRVNMQSLALVELGALPEVTLEGLSTRIEERESRKRDIVIARERSAANLASRSGFQITPFVGLRFRGDINWIGKPAAEFGFRATIPLFQPLLTSRSRGITRYRVLAEQSDSVDGEEQKKEKLKESFDRYKGLDDKIDLAKKIVELKKELLRVRASQDRYQISSGRLAPEPLLMVEELQAGLDLYSLTLEKKRTYFELLHLSGETWHHEAAGTQERTVKKAVCDAIWVWNSEMVIRSSHSRSEFQEFVQLNRIDHVFLSVKKELASDRASMANIRMLIRDLHRNGTSVSALIGDPHWVFSEGRERMLERIARIDASDALEPFDAIHLDIEPHALDSWDKGTDKSEILNQLIESVYAARDRRSKLETNLRLEIDLPAFYGKLNPVICQKLIESVDCVTIMAYECIDAQKLLSRAGTLVRACVLQRIPFFIGLRSSDFGSKYELLSLKQAVAKELETVSEFQGFALHDYEHFRSLN